MIWHTNELDGPGHKLTFIKTPLIPLVQALYFFYYYFWGLKTSQILAGTVMPTKSDSDIIFCFQLLV